MKTRIFLLCLSLVTIPSTSIFAEEEASVFDEVVVTARKRAEYSQSVPIPISALNEEQLEIRNIVKLTDIEKLAPNLSIQGSAVNSGVLEVYMRGIGQANWAIPHDPKIGLYTDGVYAARPQGGLVDLYDLQRVEVLRGPQGTLFGKNTTGGAINITTKKPQLGETFADLDVTLGYHDSNDGSIEKINAAVNLALTDNLAIRIAVLSDYSDGYYTNSKRSGPVGTFVPGGADLTTNGGVFNPANGANMTQDANGDFYVQGNGEKIGGTEVLATKFKVRFEPTDNYRLDFTYENIDDTSETVESSTCAAKLV